MDTNDLYDDEQLNRQIDAILSSEEQLGAALESDNPLLRIGAHLANEPLPVPSAAAKARMLEKVQSAQIPSLNFMAWGVSLVATVAIVILGGVWFASFNAANSPENITTPDSVQVEETIQLTEEASSEALITEEASDEPLDTEVPSETSEDALDTQEPSRIPLAAETELPIAPSETVVEPESSPEIVSTAEVIPESSASSDVMYVNPGGAVNVRSGAATSFEIIATVTPNTEVTRISTSAAGDWVEVILPDNTQGWIASFLLSERQGSDGQPISPGSDGRDTNDCDGRGNSCNAPGQTGENQNNSNNRGGNNKND
jgi:SH3 domain-containing protein